MFKACIFDLDGVIVDTAYYHFLAWQRLAKELNIPFTLQDNERLKGVSRMQSLDILLEIGKTTLAHSEKERLATRKNQWFVEYVNAMKPEEVFPGVRELIAKLKSKGLKIALASSSKNAASVVKLTQIESAFDVIIDGTMIAHTKPDPEIFLLAASRLHLKPDSCLVFEDAEAGVEAALAAGMKCVGVGHKDQLSKANLIIEKTGDFKVEDLDSI